MTTETQESRDTGPDATGRADTSVMPPNVRRAVYLIIGAVCAVALYLTTVRGDAMMFDLPSAAARMFCL
jgi:hypothetical protein